MIPTESHFGDNIPLLIEPIGSDDCTALSLIKIAYSQTKNNYDVATLWNATPQTANGTDPRYTIATAIKNGLLNTATKVFDKIWNGYFDATVGMSDDIFTKVQNAMNAAQSSCMINGFWYENWDDLSPNAMMPAGDVVVSEHSFVFVDWVVINGSVVAKIDAHQGYDLYMPVNVFNDELSKVGCSALMPSNATINARRSRDLIQWI